MTTLIKMKYPSIERFMKDFATIKRGVLFLPSQTPYPVGTILSIEIVPPGIDREFPINGMVYQEIDEQKAIKEKKQPGMMVDIPRDSDETIAELEEALRNSKEYMDTFGTVQPKNKAGEAETKRGAIGKIAIPKKQAAVKPGSDDSPIKKSSPETNQGLPEKGFSIDWIRQAIELKQENPEEDRVAADESTAEAAAPPPKEKTQLSIDELGRMKPVGDFIINMTRAMLRSGYYAPDHPGSEDAKAGIYGQFMEALGEAGEIMLTNQESSESSDVQVSGILDDPVSVRRIGMADAFLPKLQEYFERKGLVSFAIKKTIVPEHFKAFMDIMADPKVDRTENDRVGEVLTRALVENGITEISTVFTDDLIMFHSKLPWRVEMAMQRLAKDLKVLPQFKDKGEDELKALKVQIVEDILRPMKHPSHLKDFIMNCDVIAEHVKSLEVEELEKIIIDAFPMYLLLSTSQLIFDELDKWREKSKQLGDESLVRSRFKSIKRILQAFAERMIKGDSPGTQKFLEQLYFNHIVSYDDLSPGAKYLVATTRMIKDVQENVQHYVSQILNINSSEDGVVLLKWFYRVAPVLMENDDWPIFIQLIKAAERVASQTSFFSSTSDMSVNPFIFFFYDHTDALAVAYDSQKTSQRHVIEEIIARLGFLGIKVMGKVLTESESRDVRKAALDFLMHRGDMALDWAKQMLEDKTQKWYVQRNAVLILGHIGTQDDISAIREFLSHEHPRVREEAMKAMINFKTDDMEDAIASAIDDEDEKIRRLAMKAFTSLSHVSDETVQRILSVINAEWPQKDEDAHLHMTRSVRLLKVLSEQPSLPNLSHIEDCILNLAKRIEKQGRGLLKFLKSTDQKQGKVLSSAVEALGKLGGMKSMGFLEEMAESGSALAHTARKAIENINQRDE